MIIYQANIQHGTGTDNVTNYSRQITELAKADLIAVQERTTSDTGWDSAMASAGLSEAVYRENDPSQGDGPAIWYKTATVTKIDTYQHDLSEGAATAWSGFINVDKAAVAAKVTVEGHTFYFVSVHLAWSKGADSDGSTYSAIRVAQITELLSWIDSALTGGLDILIAGDLNFGPDYPKDPSGLQIDPFIDAGYIDLWRRGMLEANASANWGDRNSDASTDMPVADLTTRTHDTRRIDFYFLKKNTDVFSLTSIDLPDLRANCSGALTGNPAYCPDTDAAQRWGITDDFGVRPSDHNWVKLTLGVTGPAKVKARYKMIAA